MYRYIFKITESVLQNLWNIDSDISLGTVCDFITKKFSSFSKIDFKSLDRSSSCECGVCYIGEHGVCWSSELRGSEAWDIIKVTFHNENQTSYSNQENKSHANGGSRNNDKV